jgi:hypothetical protein
VPAANSSSDSERSAARLRLARQREIQAELQGLSDEELLVLTRGTELEVRGHASVTLPQSEARVFVKLLPMTALELQQEHRDSTANLFGLPSYYHYRIGSSGFGAWRELEAHRLANQWVLSGECAGFPLLHESRVLPLVNRGPDDRLSMSPWGDDAAIRGRISAIKEATVSLALFLEHLPLTLSQWLRDQLTSVRDPLALVLEREEALLALLTFVRDQGLLHMDAHFENVLTDGSQLFLSDLGLAISRTFQLDAEELEFFERHQSFDHCTAVTSMVHAVVSRFDTRDDWRVALQEILDGTHIRIDEIPPALRRYLARRGPVALAAGVFYGQLLDQLRTEFPAARVQELLRAT